MIVKAFLDLVVFLVTTVFSVIPSLPPMPPVIVAAGNYGLTLIQNGIGLTRYMYGSAFFTAVIAMGLLILAFDQVWDITMFVLRKIPFLNIN